MRTFTVTEQANSRENVVTEYQGFNRAFVPSQMDLIAVTICEGELDVYVMDDTKEARMQFVKYLTNLAESGHENAQIVGIYKRAK